MPTIKQKRAFKEVVNGSSLTKAMMKAGFAPSVVKRTNKLTRTKGWKELMKTYLDDEKLAQRHEQLLNSTRVDHMVFPLGPLETEDDTTDEAALPEEYRERTTLTDKDITTLLAEVNCTVRKIVHGQTARHVYFWSADNKARKEALDMAYKLKRKYSEMDPHDFSIQVNIITPLQKIYEGTNETRGSAS